MPCAAILAGRASRCAIQGLLGHFVLLCDFRVGAGPIRLELPPNRRTRKCLVGRQKSALRAPQADYRGPRTLTIIVARTMGTKVRLFGEKGEIGQNTKDKGGSHEV